MIRVPNLVRAAALVAAVLGGGLIHAGTPLAEPQRILWEEGVKNAYPHWSKDGSKILYQSNRSGTWHLYVMHRDGSNQTQLTHGKSNNNFPDWSPDNRSVVFVSDRDGNEDIYLVNADGGAPRNLSRNPARDIHPYWTPDGKAILFNSTRDGEKLQIYEMDANGASTKRLVRSEDDDSCARVSPDGKRIVYLTNLSAGGDDVLVRARDGAAPVNVTNDQPADGWPCWTPDGRIVFSSRREGAFSLYAMSADGSALVRLTKPEDGFYDGRANVAPDGRRFVFNRERGDTIGILVVDFAREKAPTPVPASGVRAAD